jgi:hypothetical protein
MRRVLTGYAGTFNRRHHRQGSLCQNRYKSILCQEEPYLLELVRYLRLNPLRAGLVKDLRALDRYPWSKKGTVKKVSDSMPGILWSSPMKVRPRERAARPGSLREG